jgi:hypothetical protein
VKEAQANRLRLLHPTRTVILFQGEITMKRLTTAALSTVFCLLTSSGVAFAQVKRVEMKIDGYLCGN